MNNKFVQASVIKNREVKINNTDLLVKEFNGQRVVTFKDIDMLHERVEGTAKRNFQIIRNTSLRMLIIMNYQKMMSVRISYFHMDLIKKHQRECCLPKVVI